MNLDQFHASYILTLTLPSGVSRQLLLDSPQNARKKSLKLRKKTSGKDNDSDSVTVQLRNNLTCTGPKCP